MPEKIAAEAGQKLITDYGLVGALLVVVVVVLACFGWFAWWAVRKMVEQARETAAALDAQAMKHEASRKEQRVEFLAALKDQRGDFTRALAEQAASQAAAQVAQTAAQAAVSAAQQQQLKDWRAEFVAEARATREMIQQASNRQAADRLEAGEGRGGRRGHGGGPPQ